MKPEDEDDPRFADLIGDIKPLKGSTQRLPPAVTDSASKKPRPGERDAPASPFRWPDPEERLLARCAGVSDQQLRELAGGEPAPEERIDLHRLRTEAAQRLLAQRLESAHARGLRCVLLIHGQGKGSPGGEAILRQRLPDWLSKPPLATGVLAFAPAPNRLGGQGATLVLLSRS